ncbi:MAG: peptidoglycan recognition family protein [Isosphaeraceae bacterium]
MRLAARKPLLISSSLLACLAVGLRAEPPAARPGEHVPRVGDEIMVCGQLYHTTAPVVLWLDPGGYDAYRLERRFVPPDQAHSPLPERPDRPLASRYGLRRKGLSPEEVERVRGGGWDLPTLQKVVYQFVLHFDARGTSRRCFEVLHDLRGLSVHFMLDLDGTIYQTLDVKESAYHATIANGRSVGIEIANVGAYPDDRPSPLGRWYERDAGGRVRIVVPDPPERDGIRDRSAPLRPARDESIVGTVQGQELRQYDFTDRQYDSLARLTATLCALFPRIRLDYPRDDSGALIRSRLPDATLSSYRGILGHYHVQTNKVDPGPAFQWDRLITESRARQVR